MRAIVRRLTRRGSDDLEDACRSQKRNDMTAITVVRVPQLPPTSIGPAARRACGVAIAAWRQKERKRAETILPQTRGSRAGKMRTFATRNEEGYADPTIIEAAEAWNADLVVSGSRGLGPVKKILLGTVCRKIVRYAPCSVLVAKQRRARPSPARLAITDRHTPSRRSRQSPAWGSPSARSLARYVTSYDQDRPHAALDGQASDTVYFAALHQREWA